MLPELGALLPPMPVMMPIQNSTASVRTVDMFVESLLSEDAFSQQRMDDPLVTQEGKKSDHDSNLSREAEYTEIYQV